MFLLFNSPKVTVLSIIIFILPLRFTLASEFLIALLGVEPSASPCYREHAATGRAFCL
jgi:hypothetical protein